MLHPDDYHAFVESIRASARDLTPWRQEYRVRFPDGEVRWLLGNAIPGRHAGSSILWHGFITDETEQRQARDEAMLMRSRMQAVVQGSTQLSIIATDLEGIITVLNSGAERLLGYTAAEMIEMQRQQRLPAEPRRPVSSSSPHCMRTTRPAPWMCCADSESRQELLPTVSEV